MGGERERERERERESVCVCVHQRESNDLCCIRYMCGSRCSHTPAPVDHIHDRYSVTMNVTVNCLHVAQSII